ncbi:hypothetical protein [Streptomyces sp. MH13]
MIGSSPPLLSFTRCDARVEAVRADTASAAGAYPFLHAPPSVGACIGRKR